MPAALANISIDTCSVPYGPDEPYGISPGRFLASSTNSFSVFHGASAGTPSTVGSASTRATGASCETS